MTNHLVIIGLGSITDPELINHALMNGGIIGDCEIKLSSESNNTFILPIFTVQTSRESMHKVIDKFFDTLEEIDKNNEEDCEPMLTG